MYNLDRYSTTSSRRKQNQSRNPIDIEGKFVDIPPSNPSLEETRLNHLAESGSLPKRMLHRMIEITAFSDSSSSPSINDYSKSAFILMEKTVRDLTGYFWFQDHHTQMKVRVNTLPKKNKNEGKGEVIVQKTDI